MVILIGGAGCVGKTLMSQKLLEIYKIPYLSIDHLKMGIFKGCPNCGFTLESQEKIITEKLWPIIKGIIMTNIENDQNIIIEGCYFPESIEEIGETYLSKIVMLYIIFSEEYIIENFFTKITGNMGIIENRKKEFSETSERAVSAMSDDEFDSRFPNEKAAIDWFIDLRYKGNPVCPHCKTKISIYRERARLKVFHCSHCNNSFSPIKGTIFEKTHIAIRKWFKVIRNLLNDRAGYSACPVTRDLKVTYKTAWRMLQQIRIAMANREIEQLFEGVVEVDETYTGGKPRKTNAVLDKKGNVIKPRKFHRKRGRGTNKFPVVGAKERSASRVYAQVMLPNKEGKSLTGNQVVSVIHFVCKEGTIINTDEFKSYNILDNKENRKKYTHVTVNHSKGQYSDGKGNHINGIENFWSLVKNGIRGVYHHISLKYLQKYVDEYSFRQNTRLDISMFDMLLGQCILT